MAAGGLRFAFYGRISTAEYQDPVSSRAWQVEAAQRVVAGRGRIVVEFFDPGASRSLPWHKRPAAAALMAATAEPDRGFDAVVVAEFERAFAGGGEARRVIDQLQACGVQVWLPEAEGPVDLGSADHRALLMLLGHQSQREVLRTRVRVRAAMIVQVREQGRHFGGRPPYGYQLVDGGPHPNAVQASWGRRQHRLAVDPVAAEYVRWIFARRLEGWSAAGIARVLNERRVPSPGVYDRAQNPHREGTVWTLRTVSAILANPRYTGRQVWNRQFTDHREAVPGDRRTSSGPVRVWNPRTDWVVHPERTHPALVSDEDFTAVQEITARATPEDGLQRRYALTGLLVCELCGRRMSGHWVNGRAGYRCRHGHTSAQPADEDAPRWVYRSEGRLVEDLIAANPDLAGLANAGDVAAYLKARGMVVVCGHGTLAIEDAAGEPTEPPTVDAVQVDGIPIENAVPTESPVGEGKASGAASTVSFEGWPARRSPLRNGQELEKGQVAQNPNIDQRRAQRSIWGLTCPRPNTADIHTVIASHELRVSTDETFPHGTH
ncbi:recombinase family protein [Actinoplanes sp. NEAU-A12]|uniref:Recombinase family protein n=1 Tax=Actinoplanes sandaracinus TaxID=3045177 RepID=A0ABT6X1P6_9ACTN|nr:recombinase family protein [Actinoplanes sandaracinus]MDI6105923.1 recombinase family protein [Actinoplanes sandaracinus]